MDEGLPIAYQVLDKGVPVLASDGAEVGTVHHVVAAAEQDIFHGIVFANGRVQRFVAAAEVDSLHEHAVHLRIDAASAAGLPEPHRGAPIYTEDPGAQEAWRHWLHRLSGRGDWNRHD